MVVNSIREGSGGEQRMTGNSHIKHQCPSLVPNSSTKPKVGCVQGIKCHAWYPWKKGANDLSFLELIVWLRCIEDMWFFGSWASVSSSHCKSAWFLLGELSLTHCMRLWVCPSQCPVQPELRGGHGAQGQSHSLQGVCILSKVKQGSWKGEFGVSSTHPHLLQETVHQSLPHAVLSCPCSVLQQAYFPILWTQWDSSGEFLFYLGQLESVACNRRTPTNSESDKHSRKPCVGILTNQPPNRGKVITKKE